MDAAWTETLASYNRTTTISNAIDSDKHEAAFDAAASSHGEAIGALLNTPAPDLHAVATKLQIIHRDGYQHMLAPILIDVERLAGAPTDESSWGEPHELGYALPRVFPNISPEIASAADKYRAAYFSTGENAGSETSKAAQGIANARAKSIPDLAAKIMLGMLECEPVHQGERLIIDLGDFPTDGAAEILLGAALDAVAMIPRTEDPHLVQAFETYRDNFARLKALGDDANEDAFYARMDPADMVMKTTPARTAAGVAMKLKRVFVSMVGEHWSDHAVFKNRPSAFADHVRLCDLYTEMFWRAIEDLERMTEGC